MAHTKPTPFVYAGKEIPPYGEPGQILVKTSSAFYYTGWEHLQRILDQQEVEIDEGEYA